MKSCLFLLAALSPAAPAESRPTDPEGRPVPAFTLADPDGRNVSSDGGKDIKAVVVVFVGAECVVVGKYMPRLRELHAEFASRGVRFLAVNSNDQDSPTAVRAFAGRHAPPFPVLRDVAHRVADSLGATRTPEAVVLDARRVVRYRGRIDDQFGPMRGTPQTKPGRRDLAEALEEVLAGKAVTVPRTPVEGCYLGRRPTPKETGAVPFAGKVDRILRASCQECHRAGGIGPMALVSYDDAAAWADTIRELVAERRMPPWHADPRHGSFANDRSLSSDDRDALLAWIDGGCPKGDGPDLPPATYPKGWAVGKPDVVLTIADGFAVPAKGPTAGIPYQRYRLETRFDEDVWVRGAEARPGSRDVVHHMIAFIGDPQRNREPGRQFTDLNHLVSYVPGGGPSEMPEGVAKRIPKGTPVVLEMHYTSSGVARTDRSSVGLVLSRTPPKHEARTRYILNKEFVIPAGAGDHRVTASAVFEKPTVVLSLRPHMHVRGKSFEYRVRYPDGRSAVLLSVPRYDFHWQTDYRLKEPLRLPAGTTIECVARFDNSATNPNKLDATKEVRWGEQSWEEMMIGAVLYYLPDEPPPGRAGK